MNTPRPASCSYWKLASEGAVFHTTADDHVTCTIGAYTHGVSLSPEKAAELESTIGRMIELNYLRPEGSSAGASQGGALSKSRFIPRWPSLRVSLKSY